MTHDHKSPLSALHNKAKRSFNSEASTTAEGIAREQEAEAQRLQQKRAYQYRLAREKVRIFDERSAPYPHPKWEVADLVAEGSIHEEAVRRVNAQIKAERDAQHAPALATADNEGNVRPPKSPDELAEREQKFFKAQVHEIVSEAQKTRQEASRRFIQNRERLVDEAKANGSQNPERDVAKGQKAVHQGIDEEEHKKLHSLFQSHGWNYDKQAVAFKPTQEHTPRKHPGHSHE